MVGLGDRPRAVRLDRAARPGVSYLVLPLNVQLASTGAENWQRTLEGKLLSDPLLVGQTLLVANTTGEPLLTAFLAESGATRWSFTPSEGQ